MSNVIFNDVPSIHGAFIKETEMSYPNGTRVVERSRYYPKGQDHFNGLYEKHVYLSPKNPLYKAGLQSLQSKLLQGVAYRTFAYDLNGNIVARDIESVKALIKAIKKLGLKI